jgi:ribose transport system permease protein
MTDPDHDTWGTRSDMWSSVAVLDEPSPDTTETPASHQRLIRAGLTIVRLGPLLILLLLIALMSFLSPYFFTKNNLFNLGVQSSSIAILALGQLLVIVTRGIDLSVAAILGLSTVLGATAFKAGWPGALVVALMLTTGAGIGLINGLILVVGRIPHPFIVTLGMLNVATGVALMITNGLDVRGVPGIVSDAGAGYFLGAPVPIFLTVGLTGLALVLTMRVKWGRWIYAVGGNPEGARRVGIPVNQVLVGVYILSGLAAGMAAIVIAGRTGVGSATAYPGAELDAIAAAIIGGASFFGGRGSVIGVVAGALVIGVIRNGLNLLSVSPYVQLVVIGTVVVVAVGLDVFRSHLEVRFRVAQAGSES